MRPIDIRQASIASLCEAIGVSQQDWSLFTRWGNGPRTPEALDQMNHYIDVMIGDRCAHPRDDLLGELIEFEIDGQGLTTDEIRAFVATLTVGSM